MFGLPPETAALILNTVARKVVENVAPPNERLREILDGDYAPVLVEASTARAHQFVLNAVGRYGTSVKVMQLVLPDAENRLPWDNAFDETMKRIQPLLTT